MNEHRMPYNDITIGFLEFFFLFYILFSKTLFSYMTTEQHVICKTICFFNDLMQYVNWCDEQMIHPIKTTRDGYMHTF